MSDNDSDYSWVDRPVEIEGLLGILTDSGGASLQLNKPGNKPLPVLVVEQEPEESLTLDISAIREVSQDLLGSTPFRLLGQTRNQVIRTPFMTIDSHYESDGRLLCTCPYPLQVEVLQRRESFRARLRLGMKVGATLRGPDGETVHGELRDLSLEGCQLDLPVSASNLLSADNASLELELSFPNDDQFVANITPRHQKADTERHSVLVGCRFIGTGGGKERQLWFFVREIEREAARYDEGDTASRKPSELFQGESNKEIAGGRRSTEQYATPMARRLARIASYLDAQLLELQQGNPVDSVQLSRHADRLLVLYDEDREALLFATRCLHHEPRLVRHCLAVSVFLLDLAGFSSIPRELRKAMVATGMVHDLGKALLQSRLWAVETPDEHQRRQMHQHVDLLMSRLGRCGWLSTHIVNTVGRNLNERLDGSGYPRGLTGQDLHELARAAAVVDAIDAMRRDRPDRGAWRIDAIYAFLMKHPEQFDRRWVERYIKQFGRYPIGSLVRYTGGQLAWVQSLDEKGYPARVQLTDSTRPPEAEMGDVRQGRALQRLGNIEEEVPVST